MFRPPCRLNVRQLSNSRPIRSRTPSNGPNDVSRRTHMRRVVVTGMGIVSLDRKQHAGSPGELCIRARNPALRRSDKQASRNWDSARQVHGAPTAEATDGDSGPPRHAFPRRRHGLELMSRWIRRFLDAGLGAERSFQPSAPASSWARAARRRAPSSKPQIITRSKGPKRVGPLRRAEVDVFHRLGDARHLV